ncbi:MAG: 16S rRNA (cytosine(1402)-N(4))-methyltransferase RsmH [Chlamydiales bacterium]
MFHHPVLLEPFLSFFSSKEIHTFVDATVGAAGHSYRLLETHPEIKKLYGIDQDKEALDRSAEILKPFGSRVELIRGNFREIDRCLAVNQVDGILFDLGVSSMQLDQSSKGFSLYKEGPLDMRMNEAQPLDAATVVNTFSEKELGRIFREYGEEPRWRKAAKAIVEGRKKKKITTTIELTELLKRVLTWGGRRGKRIHPATLVFQALRIYVNDELGAIEEALPKAIALLSPGGRLGVIAFHSLEDRIVKQTFNRFAREEKTVHLLTKKVIQADRAEIKNNPRSRSAKMRFVEKKF